MRRRRAEHRVVAPDPKYKNMTAGKFINYLMKNGKKYLAESIFYKALDIAGEQTNKPGTSVLSQAVNNVKPTAEVRPKRIGGATYQVPREVRADRRIALGIKWIISAARKKKGKPMARKLAEELILAAKAEGTAYKRRQDTHKMAEANKAFARYKW